MDLADAPQIGAVGYEHVQVGVVKGAADLLKFGRGLNPMDPYNLTHPAMYLDHVNTVASGLVQVRDHPMQLVSAITGSGWGHDPSEAAGKALFNLLSGAATGGGEAGAVAAERVGIDAVENAAKNEAVHAGESTAANSAEKAAAVVAKHPVEPVKPVPTNPAGIPDDWLKPPAEGGTNPYAHAAPAPAPEPAPAAPPFKSLPREEKMRVAQDEISQGAQSFADKDQAVAYGHQHWDGYVESLPQEQRAAVEDYTKGAQNDNSYRDINRVLRTGKGGNAEISSHIEQIDKALSGCKVPEDVVVSRGVDLSYLKLHPSEMPGEIFTEDGYMSTSLGKDPAAANEPAVLHLKVPAGTNGMYVGNVSRFGDDEAELLLGHGQKWKVSRVIKGPDGKLHVYGEVL